MLRKVESEAIFRKDWKEEWLFFKAEKLEKNPTGKWEDGQSWATPPEGPKEGRMSEPGQDDF